MSPLRLPMELYHSKTYFERFLIKSFESQKVAVAAGLIEIKVSSTVYDGKLRPSKAL